MQSSVRHVCVKQAAGQGLVEGDMTAQTFARLAPAFPYLDALVLNGIGEPMLHRGLEEFIELAKGAMPCLLYTSDAADE